MRKSTYRYHFQSIFKDGKKSKCFLKYSNKMLMKFKKFAKKNKKYVLHKVSLNFLFKLFVFDLSFLF